MQAGPASSHAPSLPSPLGGLLPAVGPQVIDRAVLRSWCLGCQVVPGTPTRCRTAPSSPSSRACLAVLVPHAAQHPVRQRRIGPRFPEAPHKIYEPWRAILLASSLIPIFQLPCAALRWHCTALHCAALITAHIGLDPLVHCWGYLLPATCLVLRSVCLQKVRYPYLKYCTGTPSICIACAALVALRCVAASQPFSSSSPALREETTKKFWPPQ